MGILNEKTLKILQSLNNINNSVIMSYPVVCVKDGKSVQAYFNLENLGETQFEEFGIYGVSDFLSAVALIEDPNIELIDKVLHISNNKSKVVFNTANTILLEELCRGDSDLLNRIKQNESIGKFTLTNEVFKQLRIASNALKNLPNLEVSGEKGKNELTLTIKANEKASNSYVTSVEGEANEDFSLLVNLTLLKKIPNGDYDIEIFKSKKTGSKVLVFKSVNVSGLEIILSVS